MLKNKNLNIVLAIIIAVALWAYVLGDVNPTTSVTVKDVPITFINQESLENSNMVMLDCSDSTINITVSGQRTEATKVKQSDFRVVADVEALNLGSNVVRLSVKGPDNVEITNISTDKITVTIDELVSVKKEISVIATGDVDSDKEPYVVDLEKDSIVVTGAKSLVSQVDRVNAIVNAEEIGNSMKTLTAELEAVDLSGKTVENVTLENNSMNVTVVMHHKKTVSLEVPVENLNTAEYEIRVNVPKTIVIKGENSILSQITSVTCEPVDLSNCSASTTIELNPIIPDGVQISTDSDNLFADVVVKALSKATLRVTENDIELINSSDDLNYDIIVEDMTITVQGKESELIGMDISNFVLSADVEDLKKGTHTVKVKIECLKDVTSIKPSTDKITIVIE